MGSILSNERILSYIADRIEYEMEAELRDRGYHDVHYVKLSEVIADLVYEILIEELLDT